MSRIGKQSIQIPEYVSTNVQHGVVYINGPKGKLLYKLPDCISIKRVHNKLELVVKAKNNSASKELYGLSRTVINNMIIGVSEGFKKQLEIQGVGYRAQTEGIDLVLNVGYSHIILIKPPKDIKIDVKNNTRIIVSGTNKEIVGQIAAKIRSVKPPEPYKGKGIRYLGEIVQRKAGKTGKNNS